jgi:hypothetical protein
VHLQKPDFCLNIAPRLVKGQTGGKGRALEISSGAPLNKPVPMICVCRTVAALEAARGGNAVNQPKRASPASVSSTASEPALGLSHLRREARTALELAVIALAPSELVDRLAAAAGLLEALIELPANSPPALALVPGLVERTRRALGDWQIWQRENLEKKMPRG